MDIQLSDIEILEMLEELTGYFLTTAQNAKTPSEYKDAMEDLNRAVFATMAYNLNGFHCPNVVTWAINAYFDND